MSRPATTTCPSSRDEPGQRGCVTSTIGTRHRMPKVKRSVRNVNGGACCRPIFVAMKPDPHTATKYHASTVSTRLVERVCNYCVVARSAPAREDPKYT